MITLKLKYDCSEDDRKVIEQWRHGASVVTRCAFNLFRKEKELKEVREILKNYNFTISDSWIINSAIAKAEGLWKSNEALGGETVIFGGKENFKKRAEGKISKEEFRHKRLMPLFIVGQNAFKGNRKSELHLDDNQLLLKLDKNTHIPLSIKINSKTQKRHLENLAEKA